MQSICFTISKEQGKVSSLAQPGVEKGNQNLPLCNLWWFYIYEPITELDSETDLWNSTDY